MINSFPVRREYPFQFRLSDFKGTATLRQIPFEGIIVSPNVYDWLLTNIKSETGNSIRSDDIKIIVNKWAPENMIVGIGERAKLMVKMLLFKIALQAELSADVVYVWDPVIG